MTGDRAFLARVPRPAVDPGALLVQTHFTLISTGTELAGLKAALSKDEDGAAGRVKELTSRAGYYLGKAIQNPGKAAERLKQIAAARVRRLTEASKAPAKSAPKVAVLSDLGWQKAGAASFDPGPAGAFRFRSDDSPAGYQVMTRRIAI